jgi:hypothetical protein
VELSKTFSGFSGVSITGQIWGSVAEVLLVKLTSEQLGRSAAAPGQLVRYSGRLIGGVTISSTDRGTEGEMSMQVFVVSLMLTLCSFSKLRLKPGVSSAKAGSLLGPKGDLIVVSE